MQLHFQDCPHNCNSEGKLFDRGLRRMINCPYCEQKRKELTDGGEVVTEDGKSNSLHKDLGFSDEYLSSYYEFDNLVSDYERPLLVETSLEIVRLEIDALRGILLRGDLPEKSYCFGLGRKGLVDRLAFPLLASAYEKGSHIGKFLASRVYYSMYLQDKDLQEYYDLDLLVVLVNSGSSYKELMCIRGLMESRAVAGKSTIFVTNNDIDEVLLLLGSVDEPSLYLASPYFMERKSTVGNHSYASDSLRGTSQSKDLGISMADLKDI